MYASLETSIIFCPNVNKLPMDALWYILPLVVYQHTVDPAVRKDPGDILVPEGNLDPGDNPEGNLDLGDTLEDNLDLEDIPDPGDTLVAV
jgi:hypothetical protein